MTARNQRALANHPALQNEIVSRLILSHPREEITNHPLVVVIWRDDEAGFGAMLGTIMRGLQLAEYLQALPFIDTRNFWTRYTPTGSEASMPASDIWHELFEPVSPIKFSDLTSGLNRVVLTDGRHPSVAPHTALEDYRRMWKKITLKEETSAYLKTSCEMLELNSSTLGVHFRVGDMRTAANHPTPPTLAQIKAAIVNTLETQDFDRVFVATQDQRALNSLRRSLGNRVISHENLRASSNSEARGIPFASANHNSGLIEKNGLRLVRETLRDIWSLSSCGGLIGGESNMVLWAQVTRSAKFQHLKIIRNGRNPNSEFKSRMRWNIRSRLPGGLGGFGESDLS